MKITLLARLILIATLSVCSMPAAAKPAKHAKIATFDIDKLERDVLRIKVGDMTLGNYVGSLNKEQKKVLLLILDLVGPRNAASDTTSATPESEKNPEPGSPTEAK